MTSVNPLCQLMEKRLSASKIVAETPSAFADLPNFLADVLSGFVTAPGRMAAGAIASGSVKAGSKALGKEIAEQAITGGLGSSFLTAMEGAGAEPIIQELSGILGPMATAALMQMPRSAIATYFKRLETGNPQIFERLKAGLEGLKDNPAAQVLLNESGALKISLRRGDIEDPASLLKSRESIREYLAGIDPEQVKALKLKAPEEYRAFLEKMVADLFPDGGDIEFRKMADGKTVDLDHFLTDRTRQDYIHTLPDTLKKEDVRVEFKNGDADKAYFIKKYFDPDIQKDVWDVLVVRNGQLRTKIARKDTRGRGYVESILMRDGFQASVPSTPGEAKEIASTHTELPVRNLPLGAQNVKSKLKDESGFITTEPLKAIVPKIQKIRDYVTIDPLPAMTRHAPRASDAAVEHAAARIAVPHMVKDLLAKVFPDSYRDPKAMARTIDILNKDNVLAGWDAFRKRTIEALEAARKETDPAKKAELLREADAWDNDAHAIAREHDVDAYKTEIGDLIAKAQGGDPNAIDVICNIQRWKKHVNPFLDQLYNEAKRVDKLTPREDRGMFFGARINLTTKERAAELSDILGNRGYQLKPLPGPSIGSNYRNPNVKHDRFMRQAKFTGDYSTDAELALFNVLGPRWNEVTKIRMFEGLKKSGVAVETEPGMSGPENIQGQDVTRLAVKLPMTGTDGRTRQVERALWVRKDLAREVRQVLGTDMPLEQNPVARVLTQIQLAQIADAVSHSKNLLTVVTRAQGAGNVWKDIVRKMPVFGTGDAVARIVQVAREVMSDSPAIREEIANLAKLGVIRPDYPATGLQKITRAQDFLHKLDQGTRIVMSRFFDNLVERGLVVDTPKNRRDYINQCGQYNGRLQGQLMNAFKQSGMSPFIVAGRNFNRQGVRGLTGNPGIQASTAGSALEMRAINWLGTALTLSAVPMMLNTITTGSPAGRSGTPLGAWDLGLEENEKGKHRVIDLAQISGLRRGMRVTGSDAVMAGMKAGHTSNQIAGKILEDVTRNVMHPWIGPAPSGALKALTGRQLDIRGYMKAHRVPEGGGLQVLENVRAALQSQNPLVYSMVRPVFEAAGLERLPEKPYGEKCSTPFGIKDRGR